MCCSYHPLNSHDKKHHIIYKLFIKVLALGVVIERGWDIKFSDLAVL